MAHASLGDWLCHLAYRAGVPGHAGPIEAPPRKEGFNVFRPGSPQEIEDLSLWWSSHVDETGVDPLTPKFSEQGERG